MISKKKFAKQKTMIKNQWKFLTTNWIFWNCWMTNENCNATYTRSRSMCLFFKQIEFFFKNPNNMTQWWIQFDLFCFVSNKQEKKYDYGFKCIAWRCCFFWIIICCCCYYLRINVYYSNTVVKQHNHHYHLFIKWRIHHCLLAMMMMMNLHKFSKFSISNKQTNERTNKVQLNSG